MRVPPYACVDGPIVFWRYALFQRSAFCLMNAFHAEPQAGALPNVAMLAAKIGRLSVYTQRFPPPMKSRLAWSKLSSAQLSTATPCAGRPYQVFKFHGKRAVTPANVLWVM